ncbi:MAG: glyoxalase [Candidatus Saccharimonadaceae bacterium]
MIKLEPIIAVHDVELSSKWYQLVFGGMSMHGGPNFDILVMENEEVLICLHKWEYDNHPTMTISTIMVGNGLILYFRVENIYEIRHNIEKIGSKVEEDIHINTNSLRKEFSVRDIDGYYLTVTEFHHYEG